MISQIRRYMIFSMFILLIKLENTEKNINEEDIAAEEFLANLETVDDDPRVLFEELVKKFNIDKTKKIHRRTFLKFLVEFELKVAFENCRSYQFSLNNNTTHFIGKKEKNIAIVMNEVDIFMGIIKDTYLNFDLFQKIVLEKFLHKFIYNLSHEKLLKRKDFIARENLADLHEDAFKKPFDIDL
jgi:hypothetical protein